MKSLGGPDGMIPGAKPGMEPPTVLAPFAGLCQNLTLQTLENGAAHKIDAVAAHHAFGAVEVDLVELTGVEDVGDVVGQFIG